MYIRNYSVSKHLRNIKHQSRLKVLHKLYYLQRDISATLVEAVFKQIKVQRKTYSFNNWHSALWHFSISGRINSTCSK